MAPNLDRLARELVVQEAALAQCRRLCERVFMADQGDILPEDPVRTAMRQMMGVFAQLDRGMTVAKLRRTAGRPTRRELAEEEVEQAGRARARQLRDEDDLFLREICAVLEPRRSARSVGSAGTQRPSAGCWLTRLTGRRHFGDGRRLVGTHNKRTADRLDCRPTQRPFGSLDKAQPTRIANPPATNQGPHPPMHAGELKPVARERQFVHLRGASVCVRRC